MNTKLITYEDKVALSLNPSIPAKNKVQDEDMNEIKSAINTGLINLIYPVGSYFETSDTEFNPNTAWGGVWQLEQDGTVLVSSSSGEGSKFNTTVGTIVGEEAHTLITNEIPPLSIYPNEGNNDPITGGFGSTSGTSYYALRTTTTNSTSPRLTAGRTKNSKATPMNNVQPSKIINRWHRTE